MKKTFIKELLQRRVPQILGSYFIGSTTLLFFIDWLVEKYGFSDNYTSLALFGLISIIPSVVILAYFHGAPGKDEWTKVEKYGIPTNILFITVVLFFGYNNLLFNIIDNEQNIDVDIFISGVQSENVELGPSREFLEMFITEHEENIDVQKIKYKLIDKDKLDKLYEDIIINSTTSFYDLYDLVTLEDMQDRLAAKGEQMNFNEIPSILRSLNEGGIYENESRNYYESIGGLLSKEFKNKPIYMFKVYAYEFTPAVNGNNIVGVVDILDIEDHFGSLGFSTNIKDFGKDVTEVINGQISNIFYKKYPSSVLSVNGNELLIKINQLAKPKKMSTFTSVNRNYSNCIDDPDTFYNQRIEECKRMRAYCDTTQNNTYLKFCNMLLTDELGVYLYSDEEYDDLLNFKHKGFDKGSFNMSIETNILIKEVFDSTAIGIIDNSESLPWIKIREGDKLILK